MDNKLITVTSPLLPNLDDFHEELKKIWDSKWITNNGSYHKQLEVALAEHSSELDALLSLARELRVFDAHSAIFYAPMAPVRIG